MFTISRRDTVPARRPLHFTVCVLSLFSPVWLCATLWTVAHQAPLSLGFSRQEYWSGLPCPSPECDTQRESYHQVSEGRGKDLIDGGWRLHVGWIGSISFEPKHLIKLGQKVIKSLQGSRSKWGPFGPPANLKGVPDARQLKSFQLGSVQFSRSVMSNSLRPHECQASLSFTNSQGCWWTHAHWVGDAIRPSHPLSSPSPPAFNVSQHQGLFKCQFFTSDGQSKVLEFQL